MCDSKPRLKFSDNFTKTTLPGLKKVLRYFDGNGHFYADAVLLADEKVIDNIYHPFYPEQKSSVERRRAEPLLHKVMEDGKPLNGVHSLNESIAYARERLGKLSPEHKRFEFPHVYKVGISGTLMNLRSHMMEKIQQTIGGRGAK